MLKLLLHRDASVANCSALILSPTKIYESKRFLDYFSELCMTDHAWTLIVGDHLNFVFPVARSSVTSSPSMKIFSLAQLLLTSQNSPPMWVILKNEVFSARNVSILETFSISDHASVYIESENYFVKPIGINERDVTRCNWEMANTILAERNWSEHFQARSTLTKCKSLF